VGGAGLTTPKPTKVQTRRTPVTLEQLVGPLSRAFHAATGEMPEPIDIAIVFGKKVAENGWPGPTETTWCHNIGNIRGVGPSGLYCVLKGAWELAAAARVPALLKAGYIVLDPPPPQAKVTPGTVCVLPPPEKQGFRAYNDLDEACTDYVHVLGTRFRRAWEELRGVLSDPADFVYALKGDGYFSGDVEAYKRNAIAGVNWALPRVESLTIPTIPAPATEIVTPPETPSAIGAATLLRAGEGEHTVEPEDPEL
jgi:hypothetical protein